MTARHDCDRNSDKPITAFSIAGIRLGDAEAFVLEELGVPIRRPARDDPDAQMFDYPCLKLRVAGNRQVEMVMALPGYRGLGPFGIQVGMAWKDALARKISIRFDEDAMTWRLDDVASLGIEVAERLTGGEEVEVFYEVANPDATFIGSIFLAS